MYYGEPIRGPIKKGRPHKLEKMEAAAEWQKADRAGSTKAKARAKGRCEVTVGGVRCPRRDFETHHHIGGWKLRGRGVSALARNKTRCCTECHGLITGNVLEHLGGNRYRRIR